MRRETVPDSRSSSMKFKVIAHKNLIVKSFLMHSSITVIVSNEETGKFLSILVAQLLHS